MKRATISAKFPNLIAHQSELSAAAIASTPQAAIAAAFRNLLAKPQLKGKQIQTVQATISLINLDQKNLNEILNKADGITQEPDEKSGMETCRNCHEQVESLARHLATCPAKTKTA